MLTIAFYVLMSVVSITHMFMLVDEQKRHDRIEEEIALIEAEDRCEHDQGINEDGLI